MDDSMIVLKPYPIICVASGALEQHHQSTYLSPCGAPLEKPMLPRNMSPVRPPQDIEAGLLSLRPLGPRAAGGQ